MTVLKPTQTKKTRIPRPANSFILFRSDFSRTTEVQDKQNSFGRISKAASKAWKALSAEARAKWDQKAERVKKQHALDNPGYKFQRQKRKEKGGEVKRNKKGGKAKGVARGPIPDISVCGRHFIVPSIAEVTESGTFMRNMAPLVVEILKEAVRLNPRVGMEDQDELALSKGTVNSEESVSQNVESSTPALPSVTDKAAESKVTTDSKHSRPLGSPNVQPSPPLPPPFRFDPIDPPRALRNVLPSPPPPISYIDSQSRDILDSLIWAQQASPSLSPSPPLADPAPRKISDPTLSTQEEPPAKRPRSSSKVDPPRRIIKHGPGLTGIYGEKA